MISKMILSEYHQSNSKTKNEELTELLSIWDKYFLKNEQNIPNELELLFNFSSYIKINNTNKYENINVTFDDSVPYNKTEKLLFSTSPTILAIHFTFHDIEMLRKISGKEFIKCSWTLADKWNVSPNITRIVDYFNTTSQYIIASIVLEHTHESRVEIFERWVQIMRASYEFRNYQFVFLIYSSLCNPAISNITKLWHSISVTSRDDINFFSNLTNASNQFENYRNDISPLPHELTCPYIGPILTQLVYINDGTPSKRSLPDSKSPLLNIHKFRMYSVAMLKALKPWGISTKFVLNRDLLSNIESLPPVEQTASEILSISHTLANEQ